MISNYPMRIESAKNSRSAAKFPHGSRLPNNFFCTQYTFIVSKCNSLTAARYFKYRWLHNAKVIEKSCNAPHLARSPWALKRNYWTASLSLSFCAKQKRLFAYQNIALHNPRAYGEVSPTEPCKTNRDSQKWEMPVNCPPWCDDL